MYNWIDDKEWKILKEKKGVILFSTKGFDGWLIGYQEAVIEAGIGRCVEVVLDVERQVKDSKEIEGYEVVEKVIGEEGKSLKMAEFGVMTMKGNFLMKAREIVWFKGVVPLENGDVIVVTLDAEHPDVPVTKKKVRAGYEGIYWFRKIDENQTELVIVDQFKLGGSIPNSLVKMMQGMSIEDTIKLKKLIEES